MTANIHPVALAKSIETNIADLRWQFEELESVEAGDLSWN